MNWLNHFLVSFILVYTFFYSRVSVFVIILFCVLFGVFLDLDFITRRFLLNSRGRDLRTFLQEPIGLFFVALPLAGLLSLINGAYFLLTLLPYATHIFLDYLTIHNVFPLSPFSKRKMRVGFIKPVNLFSFREIANFRELNENYVSVICFVILLVLVY